MPFVISNGNFATLRFLFPQKYFVFLREPYYVTLSFIYRYTMAVFLIPSFSTAIPIRFNGILYYSSLQRKSLKSLYLNPLCLIAVLWIHNNLAPFLTAFCNCFDNAVAFHYKKQCIRQPIYKAHFRI